VKKFKTVAEYMAALPKPAGERLQEMREIIREPVRKLDLTGIFCTSGSEREFTLEGSWYADQEIQAGADRDAAAAG
jgi:hypothetical protein